MRWVLMLALMVLPQCALAADVQEVVSAKGIKAWLVEDHAVPLLAVKITFRDSGAAYDPKGKEGRASMAAAMLTEGAGKLDATAFSMALEDHAIELGFAVDDDTFAGRLTSTSEFTQQAFDLMGLALQHPLFARVSMDRVRLQMLSALHAQEKEPQYLLRQRWSAQLFGDHPYARNGLGTAKGVASLKDADLKKYLQAYLTQDRLVVAVVGDITPEALSLLLDSTFGALPAAAHPDSVVADVTIPNLPQQTVVVSDIPQTIALFGTQGVKRDDPAFYDAYVMNYLLGGGSLSSRLFSEVREKRGLTYGISSGLTPMRHAALWSGSFATRNEKVGDALKALRETLQTFANEGPSEEELAKAKQYITGSFVLSLDSNQAIASFLITMQMQRLGRDYLNKRNGLMEAVTREGVKAMAVKIADPKRLQVVMVGKPALDMDSKTP